MFKRLTAALLLLAVLAALLPVPARAAEGKGQAAEQVVNSDLEAAFDGTCWYVDTMGAGCLMASRLAEQTVSCTGIYDGDFDISPVTDWPVDQVLYREGELLVSAGSRLTTLSAESGRVLAERRFDAPIGRFAVCGEDLYVLSGGEILCLDGSGTRCVVSGAERFWLEDADRLCYIREQSTISTLDLRSGAVTQAPNPVSDLESAPDPEAAELQSTSLTAARRKFPHGKYWNHMPNRGTGMRYNNQDGWTSQACYKHNGYCGTSMQTCNGYAPNGKELSYQCWGYADKLGYDVSGRDPQSTDQAYGWKKLWVSSSLNSLKAGDIIRYNKNGNSTYAHSIYVTAVNGDTITYSDCNYDGSCVIRWGQTISKSTVKKWFVFLLSAPAKASWLPSYVIDVNAVLDGSDADSAEGWATFDVLLDGELYRSGVSEFRESKPEGTSYEIQNIRSADGVALDPTGSSGLSGTLKADATATLCLDHYYLNSSGEQVKTTLTDLPRPGKWSYEAICWALENGIASGVSATRFAPNASCTRGQAMTFLWVLSGRPQPEEGEVPFTDVKPGSFFNRPVRWAYAEGLAGGKTPTLFRPRTGCTRAEILTFLWAMAGKPTAEALADWEPGQPLPDCRFTDVKSTSYYYPALLWALENGMAGGVSATRFSPRRVCTRAEILTFLAAYSKR